MGTSADHEFQVKGTNKDALFTLKLHRGEGMTLLAMNWKNGEPPADFVGFAIEYRQPGDDRFYSIKNRLNFRDAKDKIKPGNLPTLLSPIQKFRWVHFPRNAYLQGEFLYRVTPVFMNNKDELSYGDPQQAAIQLKRDTYPDRLNVTFTRGFVSSQAFIDRLESDKLTMNDLLPSLADEGLNFSPAGQTAWDTLDWMGFEARVEILALLDEAIADTTAKVYVVAYDLNVPEMVTRLEKLGKRLQLIIDDDGPHGVTTSAETAAENRLKISAGTANVKRQHMGKLQHNKTIVVEGSKVQAAVCGSTNFSWRGFFVQSNNAIIVRGKDAIKPFKDAFDNYWTNNNEPQLFGKSTAAEWNSLGFADIDIKVGFSPHTAKNALLDEIASDIAKNTKSSLFYSLAFLSQTPGVIKEAIKVVTDDPKIFVYGISDKKTGGLEVQKPNGNIAPVYVSALTKNVPQPFKKEAAGGRGTRMHHKFVVIDFDKPTARVYMGSYNFSTAADSSNGENLLLIRDRKIAVSYVIEAIRIIDHYHFRSAQEDAKTAKKELALAKPPRKSGDEAWWKEDYTDGVKIRDRVLFG